MSPDVWTEPGEGRRLVSSTFAAVLRCGRRFFSPPEKKTSRATVWWVLMMATRSPGVFFVFRLWLWVGCFCNDNSGSLVEQSRIPAAKQKPPHCINYTLSLVRCWDEGA